MLAYKIHWHMYNNYYYINIVPYIINAVCHREDQNILQCDDVHNIELTVLLEYSN